MSISSGLRIILFVIGYCGYAPLPAIAGNTNVVPSSGANALSLDAPAPLLSSDHAVPWWFVFKFNAAAFPGCGGEPVTTPQCLFGGQVKPYAQSLQFVFASGDHPGLQKGGSCVGESLTDPVGATFHQIYSGNFYFVVWNDQFYSDPKISGCGDSCSSPWGHSKGVVAWNDAGSGFVMQVTTPSWPGAGNRDHPRRADGNTLGCVDDDNVKVSQHFFALKINDLDLRRVLLGLQNASVVTDPDNPQIVKNGGPADIQDIVRTLGHKSTNDKVIYEVLSSGVGMISKPSRLHVPPWQLVSSLLDGVSLRTATWWMKPAIPSTRGSTRIGCWNKSLNKPGAVQIATTGRWDGTTIGLTGGGGKDFNHAKIGVSTSGDADLAIFGDMNQQGTLSGGNCGSSQNGRGGMFFIVKNADLAASVGDLIAGDSAPMAPTLDAVGGP